MDKPVTELKGVGAKVAAKLASLHLHYVRDILFHLPSRYEDRTQLTSIANTQVDHPALIEAKVISGRVQYGQRRSFICKLQDETGFIQIRLFYFNAWQIKQLTTPGVTVRCYGVVKLNSMGREMIHPEYTMVDQADPQPLDQHLTPVYPTATGVSQAALKKLVAQALNQIDHDGVELLPESVQKMLPFLTITQAIKILHAPKVTDNLEQAIERLAFEELLAHLLTLKQSRILVQENSAHAVNNAKNNIHQLKKLLPFELTQAQKKVVAEIEFDMAKSHPMMRLVQGDVGSGKTVVALMAAISVVESGKQAVLMAPTEILSEQHYKNFSHWCNQLSLTVVLLVGSLPAKVKREALDKMASGEADIVVGTHALFQNGVEYHELGLVIIDEQHRFGVEQRLALYSKGQQCGVLPHQLVMTATPIPRSLAMTAYAELDCSVIDELPPGRTPVLTVSVDNQRRCEVIERVRKVKEHKQQVYWVCTLIEESEVLQCQTAEQTSQLLTQTLPGFNVGLVHGRMKPAEKEAVMQAFKAGDYDILVATTVIEVGVDVPNATLMVIENAERLGLSQLHQLRGRVGRGAKKSYCILLYQSPLTEHARERIIVMRQTNDGFEIANVDLKMRGPGELLGTRQTGAINFTIADLLRDQGLLPQVHQVANVIIQQSPDCIEPIIKRWNKHETDFVKV